LIDISSINFAQKLPKQMDNILLELLDKLMDISDIFYFWKNGRCPI
jgi:hypothetical protein